MLKLLKSFRLSQDQDTKEEFRTAFFYYAEMISNVEEYPYPGFEKFPGPKCYVYFRDGRVFVFNDAAANIVSLINGTNLAAATGRTSLINSQ